MFEVMKQVQNEMLMKLPNEEETKLLHNQKISEKMECQILFSGKIGIISPKNVTGNNKY